eukprot:c10676_g1_i1.p1 GENE.c10676_g1_i1~~c10676_g1_i1.p1  ORF type:complete len:619 (+),score=174.98 c10676_g1_i1:110-1858(+)
MAEQTTDITTSPRSVQIKQLQAELAKIQLEIANTTKSDSQSLGSVLRPLLQPDTIAVTVNNEMISVSRAMDMNIDASVELVSASSDLGMKVYRATLTFVLGMAVREIFPTRVLRVEHSFGVESSVLSTAHFCELVSVDENGDTVAQVTAEEIAQVQAQMQRIVEQDLPINVVLVSAAQAIDVMQELNQFYSKKLLESKNAPAAYLNRCLDYATLHHRPLAPRTGIVKTFSLRPYQSGLLLCFPSFSEETFKSQYNSRIHEMWESDNQLWNELGIGCVGQLNDEIMRGQALRLSRLCEAFHDLKIVEVAKAIAARRSNVRIVLIAGPSSSGKTTFASKLSVHLEILGLHPIALSVDDYYKPQDDPTYPRDSSGKHDFEHVDAIRTDLLNDHLTKLFAGEEVEVPRFDFKAGQPKPNGVPTRLGKGGVIIAEGIFCLNEKLTSRIPAEQKFKVYISPMSQLNVDEQSFFSNQMIRVIRRISRDYMSRGRNAEQTIQKWHSVRAGEERNIFPFLNQADLVFNSSLEYEIPVLSVFVAPLLRTVRPNSPAYLTARQLLLFLEQFQPIPTQIVPSTSLLQEFIGGEE